MEIANFKKSVLETIANLPISPGVYIFKNNQGSALYIGKAKDLKKRVNSYTKPDLDDWKIQQLREEAEELEFQLAKDELGALILEAKLITALQPKYNIQLKNKSPFLYFYFSPGPPPKLELVRQPGKKGEYFGPFLNKTVARELFELLSKTFGLRICTRKIEKGCLYYHLGQCAGHCLTSFDSAEYKKRLNLAKKFFKNGPRAFLRELESQIKTLTNSLKFEEASALSVYQQLLRTSSLDLENASLTSSLMTLQQHTQHLWMLDKQTRLLVLLENQHQHLSKKELVHLEGTVTPEEIITSYYRDNLPPLAVFANFELKNKSLIEQFLQTWHNLENPQKIYYFSDEENNATFLDLAIEIFKNEVDKFANLGLQLQKFFDTPNKIEKIDCFDISHHQELSIVASCVRFEKGVPNKKLYRHFKIKSTKKPNDYQSLREVVYRRYSGTNVDFPDLVLIDGGQGQLNAVKNLFPNLTVASLAKREERVFFTNPTEKQIGGVRLNLQSVVGLMLVNIRNHTHNFAIRFHRKLKNRV